MSTLKHYFIIAICLLFVIGTPSFAQKTNYGEFSIHKELNTVGYKELFEYLDGLTTLDEAIFKIQSNTRRYARKQLTWYKKDAAFQWFNPDNIEEILNYIHTMISNTSK